MKIKDSVSAMMKTRTIILTGFAVFLLGALASPARAGYVFTVAPNAVTCSLDGTTGNTGTGEVCAFNADAGFFAGLDDWGSPGVDSGFATYDGSLPAYGLALDFGLGTMIDTAQVTIGNSAGCMGTSIGGATFCTIAPTDPWVATIIDNGEGIEFLAQNPGYFLTTGQSYLVQVFFDTKASVAIANGFTGQWFTQFQGGNSGASPEPASLPLIFSGLAGLYFGSRWVQKSAREPRESDR